MMAGFLLAAYDNETPLHIIPEERNTLPPCELFAPLPPCSISQQAPLSREAYKQGLKQYRQQLKQSSLQKLVFARCEEIPSQNFSPARAYTRACERYPDAFCALFHSPQSGTWLCSTPELLIKGQGQEWSSMSLAGTQKRNGEWSEKNRREQECVSQHTRNTLQEMGLPYSEEPPCTLVTGTIEHLCTIFHIQMEHCQLASLLRSFPPTPAVCGYPTMQARAYIKQNPDIERRYYAGFIGPYKPMAQTALYVTLRCMQITPTSCRLYAGGGILPESEEEAEWQETCLKMQAMRRLITQD